MQFGISFPTHFGEQRNHCIAILRMHCSHILFCLMYRNETTIRRELGWARSLTINAVRVRTSPGAFVSSGPVVFATRMAKFLDICRGLNISVMPILFDTGDIIHNQTKHSLEAYLAAAVVQTVDHPAIIGFDLCNEVWCCMLLMRVKVGNRYYCTRDTRTRGIRAGMPTT